MENEGSGAIQAWLVMSIQVKPYKYVTWNNSYKACLLLFKLKLYTV